MTTELATTAIVELLSRLLASRTAPGHSRLIWSETESDDSLQQLLRVSGHGHTEDAAIRSAALLRLRNQLVHTEIATPAVATWCFSLADPRVRREAAKRLAEAAAGELEREWSQARSQYEDMIRSRLQGDDEVGLAVAASVTDSFLEHLAAHADAIGKLDEVEAARLGQRAAEQILASARWSQVVGDRLDTSQATQLLGVTRQALHKRQANGSILGLPGDGTTWYPTWQFDVDAARIHPEVRDVLGAFRDRLDNVEPLTIAAWATTPQDEDLAGETPAQWLRAGRDPDQLRRAAERAAARLAR